MQDIFVLVANEEERKRIESDYPWTMPIIGFTVTEDMLRKIVSFCTSDYFYLIYVDLVDQVTGKWKPEDHESRYVHVTDNMFDIRIYNRRDVKATPYRYTDEYLRSGGENLIKNRDGHRLREAWPVYEDEETGHKTCTRPYFWLKGPHVLTQTNLSYLPPYWQSNRVHRWKKRASTGEIYDYGDMDLVPTGIRNSKPFLTGQVGCIDIPFPVIAIEGLQGEIPQHDAEMTYVYDPRYVLSDDAFSYCPPPHDRKMLHTWRADSGHVAICLVPKTEAPDTKEMNHEWAKFPSLQVFFDSPDAVLKPQGHSWYWFLKPGYDLLEDFERKLVYSTDVNNWEANEPWDTNTIIAFGNHDANDKACGSALSLMPPKTDENTALRISPRVATKIKPFDIIYLSYHEPYADENFRKLKSRFPQAQHVRDIKGIFNAHRVAANMVDSLMFYVVDADAIVADDFDFSFVPNPYEYDVTHVWRARNPINGLEYGYGGVKLFPTQALRDATDWHIDFTTSVGYGFKGLNQVSNVTQFNTDPFNTWKSAFRECVKLASKVIKNQNDSETEERLKIWQTVRNDAPFADYCIAGAIAGAAYGKQYKDDAEALDKINDFEWLQTEFRKYNGQKT